jgi:hypothetical protein
MLVRSEDGGAAVAANRIAFGVDNVQAMAAATILLPFDVLNVEIWKIIKCLYNFPGTRVWS